MLLLTNRVHSRQSRRHLRYPLNLGAMFRGTSLERDREWQDMDPVLRDLLDIQGDKVATMTIDRPGRRVRVDVE